MNDRSIVSPSRHATGQLHGSLHIAHWVRPNWFSAGSTRGNCSNRSLNSISEMIGIAWSWQRLYLAAPIRSSATKKCRDADMNRYGGKPPPYQADQIINRHLKELGFLAGLNDPIRVTRTQGGTPHTQSFLKHEMIKSHTARRSFCTNAYLAGLDCLDIMAISGHKTESAFLKYIKVTQEERAKRIAGHAFFALHL